MAPSKDACVLCSCVFYGKQKFLRCGECNRRAHAKCITLPDEDLQSIKSGARRFVCNACKSASSPCVLASPNDDYGGVASAATLSSSPPRTAPATQPVDLAAELLSLRALLVDALEGISFLSDQVTKLGEDNERLRRDNATKAEAHADVVKTLRQEVRALRTDLTRLRGDPPSPSRLAEFPPLPTASSAETIPPTPLSQSASPAASPLSADPSSKVVSSKSHRLDHPPLHLPLQQRTPKNSVPRPLAVGVSEGSGLVAVSRRKPPKAVFVTKLVPSTTSAQVFEHLSGVGAAPIVCKRLKTRHDSYASFYVAVDDACFERLKDPALWPRHCLFKPFRGELHEKMIHAEQQRLDDDGR